MKAKLVDPSWFNLLIPISIAIHFLFPIKTLIHLPWNLLGLGVIFVGLVLNLAASRHLRKSQTPVDFSQAPIRLVTDGPFRFSRNPMYLGGVIVLIGVAMLLGSLVSFCFPVLLFLLLDLIYIRSEEREMEERFGIDYLEYKQTVRRWAQVIEGPYGLICPPNWSLEFTGNAVGFDNQVQCLGWGETQRSGYPGRSPPDRQASRGVCQSILIRIRAVTEYVFLVSLLISTYLIRDARGAAR